MFRFMIKFLKVLGIACAIGVLIRVGEVLIIKHNENNVEETQQAAEIINDNIVAKSISDNKQTIENIDVSNINETIKQEEKTEKKEEQKQIVSKVSKDTKKQQEEKKTEIKKEPVVEKQEAIEVKEETPIVKQEEIKKEESKEEVITEEYKINNQMINQLKEIIKNNETEDMKNYGYEIVVDSSIVELTNQFTYTEYRVKNKLTYKYGTIRIYARDYYYNGSYITTQCFII